MRNLFFLIIASFVFFRCKSNNDYCNSAYQEIRLAPAFVKLKIPINVILIDSTIYDNKNILLNNVFQSPDSSVFISTTIKTVNNLYNPDDHTLYKSQISSIENMPGITNIVLEDATKRVNSISIHYIKFSSTKSGKKDYESNIFCKKDDKIITILTRENVGNNSNVNKLISDCLFESIQFY